MQELLDRNLIESFLEEHDLRQIFIDTLKPYLGIYRFEQGELVCSQGGPSEYLYVLVKGKIKIFTTSPEGRTLILSFRTPLEIIGDIEYIQDRDIINTVEAISPAIFLGIHYRWLRKYAENHAPFLRFMLGIITEKFHANSHAANFNLMYPVEVRLASYLLSVSFDESSAGFAGELNTNELADAANLIGTSYRHMNRVIHKFREAGLVERKKGYVRIIDRQGLQGVASRNIYE
ncbi:cyclic nucleotide-binding domain-containing protein [Neobacillus sp. YIM B06451]|uniref:Crp/Fnr family transcriptional regulator n=1 Tax=Neobacillus sp. YIM B06451 TaxID=3070994 RepID=UPI00292D7EF2|nr:cyclic nucleotide-binding domain-containing protein [Neobacillus sp. YIM B06451]